MCCRSYFRCTLIISHTRRDGTADDSTRMNTRSLRSKVRATHDDDVAARHDSGCEQAGGGNDDGERSTGRRTTARRGACV